MLKSQNSIKNPWSYMALPIESVKRELLYLIERHAVVIVSGPTGSGKTTQIPQFLLQNGWTGIVCTQPRRLTTISTASRVAQERGCPVGGEVGYCVRFDEQTSEQTKCRFMTDGMLFRECLHDPLLSRFSVVIIDEAHERSLHTDLLSATLKKILKMRPELRVIISSATMDSHAFASFFKPSQKRVYGCSMNEGISIEPSKDISLTSLTVSISSSLPIPLNVPALIDIETPCLFPVEISHLQTDFIQDEAVLVDAVCRLVKQINEDGINGDILVFLAGRSEVEQCYAQLMEWRAAEENADSIRFFKKKKQSNSSSSSTSKMTIFPIQLFAGIDGNEAVQKPASAGQRKVILATNVAEASITIDGVVFVIDSGRMKVRFWDAEMGFERLCLVPISKAAAKQRAGRAGRTRAGRVYRLYSRHFYAQSMPKQSIPALHLSSLTATVLQLKGLGIVNVDDFDFMSTPPRANIMGAEKELIALGAIDPFSRALTDPLGKQMAQLPLTPPLAKVLLYASNQFQCGREAAALVAMLTIQQQNGVDQNCFINGGGKASSLLMEEGDALTLVSIFMSYLRNASKSVKFCQKYQLNLKSLITAHRLYSTLMAYLRLFKYPGGETHSSPKEVGQCLIKSLIHAFPFQIARADEHETSYRCLTRPEMGLISIHPTSVLFKRLPPLIVYCELMETSKLFARFVSVIEEEDWVIDACPSVYEFKNKRR